MNFQVLPNDMLDFLDAPVPYVVSSLILCVPARRENTVSNLRLLCVSLFFALKNAISLTSK